MNFITVIVVMTIHVINIAEIVGHGMVIDPIGRGSAWRVGYRTPKNYNDNENFCGGFHVQHNKNKGKCGLCGDNYALPQPRPHENGGIYGTGNIVKKYKAGSIIPVIVKLTASHKGYFQFALCSLNNSTYIESEECFDQHPLKILNSNDSNKFFIKRFENRSYKINIALPQNLTCEHCVLRWHYRAGTNWGVCEDGRGALGCGPQETFRTCSDIAIV